MLFEADIVSVVDVNAFMLCLLHGIDHKELSGKLVRMETCRR